MYINIGISQNQTRTHFGGFDYVMWCLTLLGHTFRWIIGTIRQEGITGRSQGSPREFRHDVMYILPTGCTSQVVEL